MIKEILIKLGLIGKRGLTIVHFDGITIYARWRSENRELNSIRAILVDGEWKSVTTK
jgi:hypothetical protein